jgi:transposase
MSTTWVLGDYRRGEKTYNEHLRIIDVLDEQLRTELNRIRKLERELAELRAKYQALHQKQFKPNRKENADSRAQKADGKSGDLAGKKKRGAPVGHSGWFRPKATEIDRSVHVAAPQRCPHCGSKDLRPMNDRMEHIQEDIVLVPRPVVARYVHDQAFCARCRRPVVQAAADEILHAPIGPVAKATAMYLRYDVCIPYRKVAEIFRVLFGFQFITIAFSFSFHVFSFLARLSKMKRGVVAFTRFLLHCIFPDERDHENRSALLQR